MNNALALKIGDQWARLNEDTSITITEKSSIFDNGNSFSIPFQLNVEMNRHLLGNSADMEGTNFYDAIDRKTAVLYVEGVPLFHGVIRLYDEEAYIEDGCLSVNLESGTLTLDDMISDLNCRDVPLKDRIVLGERLDYIRVYCFKKGTTFEGVDNGPFVQSEYPDDFQRMWYEKESTINETNPYPISPYCNIRICYKLPEENQKEEEMQNQIAKQKTYASDRVKNATYGNYLVLEADRKNSSPCFYVLYFLDCLFKHLGLSFDNGLTGMEDMNRLAFVNTDFQYDKEYSREMEPAPSIDSRWGFADYYIEGYKGGNDFEMRFNGKIYHCVANSKNFPDKEVKDVLDAMKNGFGVKFIMSRDGSQVRAVYLKDVLNTNDYTELPAEIHEEYKVDNNLRGFRLTYDGDRSDTNYNYTDYKDAILTDSFNYIIQQVNPYNKNVYVDTRNGNAYRVKIDDDAKSSVDSNPSLFEVGAFADATYGDCSNEDLTETVSLNFTPVVMNDVAFTSRNNVTNRVRRISTTPSEDMDKSNNSELFAYFLDVEMMYPSFPPETEVIGAFKYDNRWNKEAGINYTSFIMQRYDATRPTNKVQTERLGHKVNVYLKYADKFENKSPIHSYDCGLTLGVMRGPGNSAGVEDIEENYDDEGNFKYVLTGKTSAFHHDTLDNYDRVFDYNGTEQGGVDMRGRFSLKLRAEKPNPEGGFFPITDVNAQRRGLFDKFWSEYAYFVTHRKKVRMSMRMELADLMQIDWTKRYRIGNHTGFIAKYEYTVTSKGVGEISMEMYTL